MSVDTIEGVDRQFWRCVTELRKWHTDDDTAYLWRPADELVVVEGNLLVYGGASVQWQTLLGNGTATAGQALTYFNNANAAIGVGTDSGTAAAATQTDLVGASKFRKGMDGGYPAHTDGTTIAARTITFRSSFGTTEANFAWNEWGIFNSPTLATGRMLNRKIQALGTKASGTWQLTITLDLT